MGLISCSYPEHEDPLGLAREFKRKMAPIVIDVDETDVSSVSITRLESAPMLRESRKRILDLFFR